MLLKLQAMHSLCVIGLRLSTEAIHDLCSSRKKLWLSFIIDDKFWESYFVCFLMYTIVSVSVSVCVSVSVSLIYIYVRNRTSSLSVQYFHLV